MITPARSSASKRRFGAARARSVGAVLLALVVATVPLGAPAPARAQEYADEAESWAYKLIAASYEDWYDSGTPLITNFRGVIRMPPTWSYLLEGSVVLGASAASDGQSYEIGLAFPEQEDFAVFPEGQLVLSGARGRARYDRALSAVPQGCATSPRARARGYCLHDGPHYEYFPALAVGDHPAVAFFGGFETGFGGTVILDWYDAAADTSYTLRLRGPDELVARAGFEQSDADSTRRPERNAQAARRLAGTAARFIGVDLSLYPG